MRFRLDVDGEQRDIEVEPIAGGFIVRIDGASYRARTRLAKDSVDVRIGPKTLRLHLQGNEAILDDGVHRLRLVEVAGEGADVIERHPAGPGAVVDVRASMPGRVVRVAVASGSAVRSPGSDENAERDSGARGRGRASGRGLGGRDRYGGPDRRLDRASATVGVVRRCRRRSFFERK